MARKRRKSSTKAKSATISASSTTGSSKVASAAPSPDLVCIDSDDSEDDDELTGKSNVKKGKGRMIAKATLYRAKSQSVGADGGAISAEICIDDDDSDDQRRVKSGGAAKKKRKHRFKDRTLVMPIHKYYYGWAEGENTSNPHHMFRFRCSRDTCQHVTYDNVGAMRHAICHVQVDDASLDADIFSELIRCPTCFTPFKSRYDMQTHFEKQHPAAATKSKGPHRCKICERDLNGQEKFVQHMRQYHVRCDMPYVCPICFYRSSIYNMVVDHFLTFHNNVQEALCPYCLKCFAIKPAGEDEKFGDTSDYMSHLTEHTITKRHKCQQCRLNFVKGNHLSTHAQCDHKTAKGEIKEIEASMIADHVPVTVSEATSKHHDEVDGAVDGGSASSASEHQDHRSQAILASFVMTLGQRAGPLSLTAEGLKAWNLQCKECHRPFDFAGHFRTATSKKFVQCNKCKFITTCSFSYAKHMIFFHGTAADRGKIVPSERKVKDISVLRCRDPACDFETEFGNKMAAHMMKLKHFAGGCAAEKMTEKSDDDDEQEKEIGKCESSRALAESDAAEYTHLLESTLEIDSDSDTSDDDDVKDGLEKSASTEVIAREILDEILAHIDPVGAVVHALVADVVDIIDDDEREDDSRSDDDVAMDEVSDDSVMSPKSPEIIALSDTDGDDD